MGVEGKPTLMVFNKLDLYRERYFDDLLEDDVKVDILRELKQNLKNNYEHDNIFISAINKENIDELRAKIKEMVSSAYEKRYPYKSQFF